MAQAKLIRVTRGAVFDVAVDVRRSSPTFGQWRGFELSEEDRVQLWIPEGFAHGFVALTKAVEVQYKTSTLYAPGLDRAIRWNDEDLAIEWPVMSGDFVLSPNDATAPTFRLAEVFD
jgi:dTDP-4-dehydrorhamnose 3,5-epimerase